MKRRSATNSALPLREQVFFIDHCLGTKTLPNALRMAGLRVEVLSDEFKEDTDDVVWMEVARRGWIILTKDAAIRKRPLELAAVEATKARVFALTSQGLTGEEMVTIFLKYIKRIQHIARDQKPPFWARITKAGVVVEKLRPR